MKVATLLTCVSLSASSMAFADAHKFAGSTTLAGVVSDALVQAGLQDKLSYTGGGSGDGEAALVAGKQGIAPMSRAFKKDAMLKASGLGINVVDHVIALDGVALFVNADNQAQQLSFAQIRGILTCTTTKWEDVAGANLSGGINAFVRDDASGTTDTIKSLVGIAKFGPCVKVVAEADDIANKTNTDKLAIGYAGLGAKRQNNRAVAVSKEGNGQGVLPTVATIRNFSYPISRQLHIYSAAGALKPTADEQQLLDKLTDRSFADPIVQDHDFVTID